VKLYLFLRSIVWTSVFSILALVASIILALASAPLEIVLALGISSVALAILSTKISS